MKTTKELHVSTDGGNIEVHSARQASVQIVLSKYVYDEDPESFVWESDVFVSGEYIGGCACGSESMAYDTAQEIIFDHEHPTLF